MLRNEREELAKAKRNLRRERVRPLLLAISPVLFYYLLPGLISRCAPSFFFSL